MAAVHEAMAAAKDQHNALPADLLTDIAEFSMPALANQANRLATRLRLLQRMPPFNLIISNVPGPTVDLYMCGARLDAIYPLSAIADGQGLNLTVLGSNGKLNFGALADRPGARCRPDNRRAQRRNRRTVGRGRGRLMSSPTPRPHIPTVTADGGANQI